LNLKFNSRANKSETGNAQIGLPTKYQKKQNTEKADISHPTVISFFDVYGD
jgi:hypothetical protein